MSVARSLVSAVSIPELHERIASVFRNLYGWGRGFIRENNSCAVLSSVRKLNGSSSSSSPDDSGRRRSAGFSCNSVDFPDTCAVLHLGAGAIGGAVGVKGMPCGVIRTSNCLGNNSVHSPGCTDIRMTNLRCCLRLTSQGAWSREQFVHGWPLVATSHRTFLFRQERHARGALCRRLDRSEVASLLRDSTFAMSE
jgi:hypothetical protein